MMTSYLLAGPAEEPVSLAEAKAFLRVDDGAEDALITTLIGAARVHLEGVTGRALLAQTWRIVLDDWPTTRCVRLPVTPFISLLDINAVDDAGGLHPIALAQFLSEPDRLLLPATVSGMPRLREQQGLEIDYVAGFGTEPEDVPADIRQALLVLVAHWFEHRDAVIIAGSGAVVPSGFDRLVQRYKRVLL
ncbi:head-tail connector protein [Devosia sp. 919]|uniref:head-tail connector protein n=2 Tax=unclassified Devosia TaxID=196773 RepID=UPI0015547990|nr:head-tail connector protein [Devosia sp. 919]